MMQTVTPPATELMQISSMADLDRTISRLKISTAAKRALLATKARQLPIEVLKAGAIAFIPGFLAARISNKGFGMASGLFSWLFHKKEEKKSEARQKVIRYAKQAGMYTGLGLLFKKIRKKFLL